MSSLEKCPFKSFCPFFNWVVCLPGVESCEFFIYFGDQALVWGIIGKYVFPYCWFSLYFSAVSFSHAEAFYFDEVPFVYSFFYVPCFRGHVCEDVAAWNVWDFPANFSSRTFMVLQLIFKSFIHLEFIHLEFIFVYGVSWWSSFIFLQVAVQISQHHLLKRLFLLHFMLCLLCQILIDHKDLSLFLGSLFHWSMCLFLCKNYGIFT